MSCKAHAAWLPSHTVWPLLCDEPAVRGRRSACVHHDFCRPNLSPCRFWALELWLVLSLAYFCVQFRSWQPSEHLRRVAPVHQLMLLRWFAVA
jgi:hypothetical protein